MLWLEHLPEVGSLKTKQGLPTKQRASRNKRKKGLDLIFHTGNANVHQPASRSGPSLHLTNFLLLGTSEYPNLAPDENLMMKMYTCSVCRGKMLSATHSNASFDIGSVRKEGGGAPFNYLATAEINTPMGRGKKWNLPHAATTKQQRKWRWK